MSKRGGNMAKEKFEEALGRLEDIVKKMEAGDMTLEESLKSFEDGIKLARLCSRKLDEAERRVEILLKQEEGLVIKPFKVEENESES
jgi:exodeoxyribonuclease VII small subunit